MTFDEEHVLETYKSLMSVSMEGLKVLLLINGGTVVALLAFLGQSTLGPELASHFWWPIGFFVAGVVFCTLAYIASYCTQYSLYNEQFPKRNYSGPKHTNCLWVAFLLVFARGVSFSLGALESVKVFALDIPRQVPKLISHSLPLTNAPKPMPHTASAPVSSAGPDPAVKRSAPPVARSSP